MFTLMISHLQAGEIPGQDTIQPRLNAAIVKKLAVVRQPYSFWSSDTKSNPRTVDMLWATILLEDTENFGVVSGILSLEEQERARLRQSETSVPSVDDLAAAAISELLELISDRANEQEVRCRVERVAGPKILHLLQKT